jgi:hypothetical protein
MKCNQCSKIIPDGFTDCPWCGASYASRPIARASAPPPPPVQTQQAPSSLNVVLAWISSLLSLPLVAFAAYAATLKMHGVFSLENSGFAMGGFFGPYLVSAIAVFSYYWIRKKKPHYSSQLLGISCGASLFALLSLSSGLQASRAGAAGRPGRNIEDLARDSAAPAPRSIPATKWDPAIRSYFGDLRSFDERYVSEVRQSESSSLPVYTPESFRDAATIQQILSQLHARMAVAEKFNSAEPLLDKLPASVQSVDASADEKQKFLKSFEASARKNMASRKIVTDIEHDWLTASIGLYEYTLSKQGAYSLRDGNLIFKSNGAAVEFNHKLQNARRLQAEFYQAYRASQNQQAAAIAQFGLRPSDIGTSSGQPPRP